MRVEGRANHVQEVFGKLMIREVLNRSYTGRLMPWCEFERHWEAVLSVREDPGSLEVLNLFADVSGVRSCLTDDHLFQFCRALYCYDLFQQVYFTYFSSGKFPKREVGAFGVLSLSSRLSPASMPLALLTDKKRNYQSMTHEEYKLWKLHKHDFREALFQIRYDELSESASEYFPKVDAGRAYEIRKFVKKKHDEIDSLISTLRYKHVNYDCDVCKSMDCYCSRVSSTLRVSLREIETSDYETQMFQKIWFTPDPDADTISVSANLNGFTMINAVCRSLGYDWDRVRDVADVANIRHEVISLVDLKPRLVIVPKTRGTNYPLTRRLLTQLIGEANFLKTKVLHMTHFGFCNGISDRTDLVTILGTLLYPHLQTTIETVIFDYDSRAEKSVYLALKESVADYKPRFP